MTERPRRWPTRVCISAAALLVKVTARICEGRARPRLKIWPIRVVSTRVLPEPAGAMIAAPVSRGVLQAMLAGEDAGLLDGARTQSTASFASGSVLGLDWRRSTRESDSTDGSEASLSMAGRLEAAGSAFRFVSDGAPGEPRRNRRDGAARQTPEVVVPDVKGLDMRAAVKRLHRAGLKVEIHGSGEVSEQVPAPGITAVRGASVILR